MLKKIGGLSYGSKLTAAEAGEASHMFFSDGVGGSFLGLLETHPPLVERIRALEPEGSALVAHWSTASLIKQDGDIVLRRCESGCGREQVELIVAGR